MNKYDILVGRIQACKTEAEAWQLIEDAKVGHKITKGEWNCLWHYVRLYFRGKEN